MNEQIADHEDALARALALAIIAPSDHKAQVALAMAEEIASGLRPKAVECAKRRALELVAEWRNRAVAN